LKIFSIYFLFIVFSVDHNLLVKEKTIIEKLKTYDNLNSYFSEGRGFGGLSIAIILDGVFAYISFGIYQCLKFLSNDKNILFDFVFKTDDSITDLTLVLAFCYLLLIISLFVKKKRAIKLILDKQIYEDFEKKLISQNYLSLYVLFLLPSKFIIIFYTFYELFFYF